MAYVAARPNEHERRLVWVDRNGVTQPIPAPTRNYGILALSPDGQQLALSILANTSANWIYDLERGTLTRFTAEGSSLSPLWTPDGKRIAYRSDRAGFRNIYWRAADGTDTEEQLTTGDHQQGPLSWSPDGKVLAFYDASPTTRNDIWILPMDGQREAEPFLQTAFNEDEATFSPDGGWLAYHSNESGRNEIYVLPFPGPGRKWQVSTDGGTVPRWNPQGGELFYQTPDNKMMVVNVTTSPTFSPGRPRVLFEGLERFTGCCEVAPDGQHFIGRQPVEPVVPSTQINVVLNWFEELKRLVPTDN